MRWAVPTALLQSSRSLPRWLIAYTLLSLAAATVPLARFVPPISPATLVYAPQDSALPLLLSPFLVPTCRAFFARLLQILWLCSHLSAATVSSSGTAAQPRQLLQTYGSLLAVRSLLGFVFTRSVGWKYPTLLAPYSLYEPIYGIGPLVVDVLLFGPSTTMISGGQFFGKVTAHENLARFASLATFAMVDGMPWTYACAAVLAGLSRLVDALWSRFCATSTVAEYAPLYVDDEHDTMLPLPSPYFRPSSDASRSHPSTPKSRIVMLALIAAATSWVSGSIPYYLHPSSRPLLAAQGTTPSPSVHVLMLTYPRDKDPASDYMMDSIESYLSGWAAAGLSANTTLTVYAHAGPDGRHCAWGRAQTFFDATAAQRAPGPRLDFVMHPLGAAPPSHYAHLADALRYAYGAAHEWTMVVEDDFALCGAWGARGVARVLSELGSTLVEGAKPEPVFPGVVDEGWDADVQKPARWRGAFVGTGGRYDAPIDVAVPHALTSLVQRTNPPPHPPADADRAARASA